MIRYVAEGGDTTREGRMSRWLTVAVLLAACSLPARADEGAGRKRRTPPQEFGRVIMANNAAKAKMPAVVFDHWIHRARYTCRVCHVDVGFAMVPGETNVRAADNAKGMYCGACHNGRTKAEGGNALFPACAGPVESARLACQRCHSVGTAARPERDFATFARGMPKGRFGNGVDWEAAEQTGLIKPADFVEGVSIRRTAMATQKDFSLPAKLAGMPEIIFSHAKHTAWSGCEGCHPQPFGLRKGGNKFTMAEIFEGRYCGVCHVAVAFPTIDCQRCHTKPVQ
jgi:c(7)-type cytochrome triheme protein